MTREEMVELARAEAHWFRVNAPTVARGSAPLLALLRFSRGSPDRIRDAGPLPRMNTGRAPGFAARGSFFYAA